MKHTNTGRTCTAKAELKGKVVALTVPPAGCAAEVYTFTAAEWRDLVNAGTAGRKPAPKKAARK